MKWFVETKTHLAVSSAVVRGALDGNTFLEMRALVRQQQLAQGGQALLLDLRRTKMNISTLDVFAIASSHQDDFPASVPIGLLIGPNTFTPADARFLENVLVNRGVWAKLFTDELAACEWLLASADIHED